MLKQGICLSSACTPNITWCISESRCRRFLVKLLPGLDACSILSPALYMQRLLPNEGHTSLNVLSLCMRENVTEHRLPRVQHCLRRFYTDCAPRIKPLDNFKLKPPPSNTSCDPADATGNILFYFELLLYSSVWIWDSWQYAIPARSHVHIHSIREKSFLQHGQPARPHALSPATVFPRCGPALTFLMEVAREPGRA
ncbi:hypothetical protein GGR51DRAFT_81083 [Nemania sp. FL0031]|nr:hypothetical protein GGR51DRAFT_81083 [Nemania sp. FL0031]